MPRNMIEVSDELREELTRLSLSRGETESQIVERTLRQYLDFPARVTDPAEIDAIRAEGAGMWKDRTDLPDFAALRGGWDERLARLFGDE